MNEFIVRTVLNDTALTKAYCYFFLNSGNVKKKLIKVLWNFYHSACELTILVCLFFLFHYRLVYGQRSRFGFVYSFLFFHFFSLVMPQGGTGQCFPFLHIFLDAAIN